MDTFKLSNNLWTVRTEGPISWAQAQDLAGSPLKSKGELSSSKLLGDSGPVVRKDSKVKRKDLKPGTVFRYNGFLSGEWYVPPWMKNTNNPPYDIWPSTASPGDSDWGKEVQITWEPPTMSNTREKPEFVVNPEHYMSMNPQPIDVIEAWNLNFHRGAALKYIGRAGRKGTKADEISDIKKAVGFLQREVARLEKLD